MKTIYTTIALLISTIAFTQNCYQTNIDTGIQKYNAKQYTTAITHFSNAKKCSDTKGNTKPNNWIAKCKLKQEEILRKQNDKKAYNKAISTATELSYRNYLNRFSNGKYVSEVRSKLNKLIANKDLAAFNKAKNINTEETYNNYLSNYPNGNWSDEAQANIKELIKQELASYNKALSSNTLKAYNDFLKKHPETKYEKNIQNVIKNLTFSSVYGLNKGSIANDFIQTSEGNYITLGRVNVEENNYKLEIVKINKQGHLIWRKHFAKGNEVWGVSVKELKDGKLMVVGNFLKSDDKYGIWILKISSTGDKIWDKTIEDIDDEYVTSVLTQHDSSIIIVGVTKSKGNGLKDARVIKLNSNGSILWDKTFGGNNTDEIISSINTKDNNILLIGSTRSKGNGVKDIWVLKLNLNGDILWDKTFGGVEDDEAFAIVETNKQNFIIAGYTKSKSDGESDSWVLKLNNLGEKIWDKTYGYEGDYEATAITQSKDGNYIISNKTTYRGLWLLKINSRGDEILSKIITQGYFYEEAIKIISLKERSLIVAADYYNFNLKKNSIWLFKLDANFDIITDNKNVRFIDVQEIKDHKEVKKTSYWKDRYTNVKDLGEGFYEVKIDKKIGVVNKDGKEIVPCVYDFLRLYLEHGSIWGVSGEYNCLYTTSGKKVISEDQKIITAYFHDVKYGDKIRVRSNDKWGFINKKTGKIEIPFKYKSARAFFDGKSEVTIDKNLKKYFIINDKGECIKKCKNSKL